MIHHPLIQTHLRHVRRRETGSPVPSIQVAQEKSPIAFVHILKILGIQSFQKTDYSSCKSPIHLLR